jgi:hypothetical protein
MDLYTPSLYFLLDQNAAQDHDPHAATRSLGNRATRTPNLQINHARHPNRMQAAPFCEYHT